MNQKKKSQDKLLEFSKKVFFIIQSLGLKNIICLGIDPGVNLGISIVSITNVEDKDTIDIQHIESYQVSFKKEISFFMQDLRIKKIITLIENIVLKYKVNVVALEQASYSSGKFSYSENLLAKYTGAIYAVLSYFNIKIIEVSYNLMHKVLVSPRPPKKDKLDIKTRVENIYPYEIDLKKLDHLDALGYSYAIYLILKIYYKYKLNY